MSPSRETEINIIYSWVGFENRVRKSKVVLQKSMTPISCFPFFVRHKTNMNPMVRWEPPRRVEKDIGKMIWAGSAHTSSDWWPTQAIRWSSSMAIHGHPWPTWIRSGHFFLRSQKKNRAKTKVLKFCAITHDITQGSLRGSLSFQTILSGIRWPTFLASGIRCFFLQSFRWWEK